MKTNPTKQGILTGESVATDPLAGRLVMARAIELALTDGRLAIDLSKDDWEQAKRELMGATD